MSQTPKQSAEAKKYYEDLLRRNRLRSLGGGATNGSRLSHRKRRAIQPTGGIRNHSSVEGLLENEDPNLSTRLSQCFYERVFLGRPYFMKKPDQKIQINETARTQRGVSNRSMSKSCCSLRSLEMKIASIQGFVTWPNGWPAIYTPFFGEV